MIRVRLDDGTFRQLSAIRIRLDDGTFRTITAIRIRLDDGTFRIAYQAGGGVAGGASAAPQSVYGSVAKRAASPVTTNAAAASASGGPYVCQWQRTDSNPGAWTILSPNSLETSFRATSVAADATQVATFVATLTGGGRTLTSPTVTATATNVGASNGGIQN